MSRCTTCQHPKRDKIDADLQANRPLRDIEETYGVGRMALQRHRGHITTVTTSVTKRRRPVTKSVASVTNMLTSDDTPETKVFPTGVYEPGAVPEPEILVESEPDYPGKIKKTWKEFQPIVIPMVEDNPMSQFEQAWELAGDDTKLQRRMVRTVVEHAMQDRELKTYLYGIVKAELQSDEMGL